MKAQQLVARLLTVPREERARVLAQEGPVSWDSVTFFAVRDGLRDARFHGQMSAADYIDTLEEVERRYEEGANAGATTSRSTSTGLSTNYRATVEDELDDQTIDLVPPESDEAVDDESTIVAPELIEQPKREPVALEPRTAADRRSRRLAPTVSMAPPASARPQSIPEPEPPPTAARPSPTVSLAPAAAPTPAPTVSLAPAHATASAPAPAPAPAPKVEFVTGATIRNRYVLEQLVGKGGTGIIFRARDARRDAPVALKVLREQLRDQPDKIERLKREFQQAQALPHPNIIRVFDVDCEGDAWFLTMELLDGESLRSHLASMHPRRLTERNALNIVFACADALSFAHEHGVVHGDFKPGNVLLGHNREIRVLDFGVAASSADGSGRISPALDTHVAAATPAYASPEVLAGQRPQIRDDVYSFACVAYEVLTRQHPFERHSAIVARQRGIKARRLPGLSRRQFEALRRGLAWSRSHRPATVRELADELRHSAPKRQPLGFWFAAAVVAAGTFIAVTFLMNSDRQVPAKAPQTSTSADVAATTSAPNEQPATQEVVSAPATPDVGGKSTTDQAQTPSTTRLPGPAVANRATSAPSVGSTTPMNAPTPTGAATPSGADAAATTAVIQSQSLAKPGTADAAATTATIQSQTGARAGPADVAATTAVIQSQTGARAGSADVAATAAAIPSQTSARLGSVSLQQANIVVSEHASHAVVRIQRRDDFRGRVTIQWRTIPGTAQPGIDYSPVASGSVSIPDDQDIRVLYIPLLTDETMESNEWFDLELTSVSGPARLGPIMRTRITILDDR